MYVNLSLLCGVVLFLSTVTSHPHDVWNSHHLVSQIVGGIDITPDQAKDYKYMAFVINLNPITASACGGIVLSESWVLTAAHCLQTTEPEDVTVFPGFMITTHDSVTAGKIVYHPDYDKETKTADVVLLQVQNLMIFDETLGNISLKNETVAAEQDCNVVGHGFKNPSATPNGNPHYIQVITKPEANCGNLPEDQICAEPLKQGNSLCIWDGGDPLVCGNELAGIGLSDENCGTQKYDVFLDISKYEAWIQKTIDDDPFYIPTTGGPETTTSSAVAVKSHILLFSIAAIILKGRC